MSDYRADSTVLVRVGTLPKTIVGVEGTSGSASMAGGKISLPCIHIDHTLAQSWDPDDKVPGEH